MRLKGKVILISGGSRGQGAAEARLFAREGACVVVGDVRLTQGNKLATEIMESGGTAMFVKLDVTSEQDWERSIGATVARFGRLDVLINNAGIHSTTPVEQITLVEWNEIMATNATGVLLGTKYAIPAMRRGSGGSIVNVSSITGIVGTERGGAYGASKGCVRALTKSTAVQHAHEGIRANSLHPGPIDTEMIADSLSTTEGRARSESRIPMGYVGSAEDIAYGALFLASDESSYMTGAELVIDGGYTAQ